MKRKCENCAFNFENEFGCFFFNDKNKKKADPCLGDLQDPDEEYEYKYNFHKFKNEIELINEKDFLL